MNQQRIILKLLIGLAAMALEHDKGFASKATRNLLHEGVKESKKFLEVQQ